MMLVKFQHVAEFGTGRWRRQEFHILPGIAVPGVSLRQHRRNRARWKARLKIGMRGWRITGGK